jgi:hypothetical protein
MTNTLDYTTAIFRQVNKHDPRVHHDVVEFPDGQSVLLTHLCEDQTATVLQLPAAPGRFTFIYLTSSLGKKLRNREDFRADLLTASS